MQLIPAAESPRGGLQAVEAFAPMNGQDIFAKCGTPIVAARPETEEAQSYQRIAARLWAKLNGAEVAAGPRIVVE